MASSHEAGEGGRETVVVLVAELVRDLWILESFIRVRLGEQINDTLSLDERERQRAVGALRNVVTEFDGNRHKFGRKIRKNPAQRQTAIAVIGAAVGAVLVVGLTGGDFLGWRRGVITEEVSKFLGTQQPGLLAETAWLVEERRGELLAETTDIVQKSRGELLAETADIVKERRGELLAETVDIVEERRGELLAETADIVKERRGELLAETVDIVEERRGELLAETADIVKERRGELLAETADIVEERRGELLAETADIVEERRGELLAETADIVEKRREDLLTPRENELEESNLANANGTSEVDRNSNDTVTRVGSGNEGHSCMQRQESMTYNSEGANEGTIVRTLQIELKKLGYNPGMVDGGWGKDTARAYALFTKDNSIDIELSDFEPDKWTLLRYLEILVNASCEVEFE